MAICFCPHSLPFVLIWPIYSITCLYDDLVMGTIVLSFKAMCRGYLGSFVIAYAIAYTDYPGDPFFGSRLSGQLFVNLSFFHNYSTFSFTLWNFVYFLSGKFSPLIV